jgi:hypothetical protein
VRPGLAFSNEHVVRRRSRDQLHVRRQFRTLIGTLSVDTRFRADPITEAFVEAISKQTLSALR